MSNWMKPAIIAGAIVVSGLFLGEANTADRSVAAIAAAQAFGNREFSVAYAYFATSDGSMKVCVTSARTPAPTAPPVINGSACQQLPF